MEHDSLDDLEERRRRACTGKKRYGSQLAADAAAERLRPNDLGFNGYKCSFCPFWHLGHSSQKRRRKRP